MQSFNVYVKLWLHWSSRPLSAADVKALAAGREEGLGGLCKNSINFQIHS